MVPVEPGGTFSAAHDDLVRGIAVKLAAENGFEDEVDELVQWGAQGFLEAQTRFDESKGIPFEAFAYYRVRGAVLDGIRELSPFQRQGMAVARRAALTDAQLEDGLEERVASGDAEVDGLMLSRALDTLLSQLTIATVAAAAAAPERGSTPDEILLSDLERRRVRKAVGAIGGREARVLQGVYFEDLPLDELGTELGLSRSAVSRIHTKALDLLREKLE